MPYAPPLTLTSRLIDLISRISEAVGRWEAVGGGSSPKLRRENRIRTIHSSLAIENIRMTQPDSPNSPTQRYGLAAPAV